MRHALDSDHLAAVAALVGGSGDKKPRMIRMGMSWAIGHSITLLGVGSVVLLTDAVITPPVAAALECFVGLLLVVLGVGVVYRVIAKRIHIHAHRHGEELHLHAHSHTSPDHDEESHDHDHALKLSPRALVIGVAHGMAGSAALVLLTLATIDSVWTGLGYLTIFAVGTIVGMGLLSCVIALPLRLLAGRMTAYYNALLVMVGIWSIVVGGLVVHENAGTVALAL